MTQSEKVLLKKLYLGSVRVMVTIIEKDCQLDDLDI